MTVLWANAQTKHPLPSDLRNFLQRTMMPTVSHAEP
jgi:hypothetical protein